MTRKEDVPWESRCHAAASDFARLCRELYEFNPYGEPPLERTIVTLMSELWDNGFSQSEIRVALESAVADLPRYAAGEERRGDRHHTNSPHPDSD
jgi:hypothetical protein